MVSCVTCYTWAVYMLYTLQCTCTLIIETLCNGAIRLRVFSFLLLQLLVVSFTEMMHPFLLLWLYNQSPFPHRRQQSCRLHLLLCLPRVRSHYQHLQVIIHAPIALHPIPQCTWSYCSPPSSKLMYLILLLSALRINVLDSIAFLQINVLDPIALHPPPN